MTTLRVSATDIDALRYFMSPPHDTDMELDELLRRLRKEEPPTEAMMAGTALHRVLETADGECLSEIEEDGYRFLFALNDEIELPPIREMKATREYEIDGFAVTLVGKVDAVHGRRIHDHKFTARYDPERFLNSYQWRIYLDVFDADEFRWNVFEGREIGPKTYGITQLHKLGVHRYPTMGADVERELSRFVSFARDFLPERFFSEAA